MNCKPWVYLEHTPRHPWCRILTQMEIMTKFGDNMKIDISLLKKILGLPTCGKAGKNKSLYLDQAWGALSSLLFH